LYRKVRLLLELSVSVISPAWFRTTVVNTDTLDCVHSETGPFVRDISIMITRDTAINNADKGTRITVITCDTKLFAKDAAEPPGVIEPFCTKSTPSTTIGLHDTKCIPAKGVSFIETDSEWFYFTNPNNQKVSIQSKTVTLVKSVLGCEPDKGEPTKFYDVFTMFELIKSKQFPTQLIIVCERGFNNNPGEIFGCEVVPSSDILESMV